MTLDRSAQLFRPSLIDRLVRSDADEDGLSPAAGGGAFRLQNVEEFTNAICRDLEDLLNARSATRDVPRWAKQCSTSILHYGLPDRAYDSDAAGAARMVRDTITTFEPRLCDVRVEPVTIDAQRPDRAVLEIRARLVAETDTAIRLSVRFRFIGIVRISVTHLV
jgi:type VI secretion system lysozyme-like protein